MLKQVEPFIRLHKQYNHTYSVVTPEDQVDIPLNNLPTLVNLLNAVVIEATGQRIRAKDSRWRGPANEDIAHIRGMRYVYNRISQTARELTRRQRVNPVKGIGKYEYTREELGEILTNVEITPRLASTGVTKEILTQLLQELS